MIVRNCTANEIQPSFSQNARSFIKARSHDNCLYFGFFPRLNQTEAPLVVALVH
jgi:hypothetical protein